MISVSGGNLIPISMTCKVGGNYRKTGQAMNYGYEKDFTKRGCPGQTKTGSISGKPQNCPVLIMYYYYWKISDKVFVNMPVTKHSNFSRIKAGDHIRIGNEHSVMVLQEERIRLRSWEKLYATVHWEEKNKKGAVGKWLLCGNKILTECFSVFGKGIRQTVF